jgi:hypothetical protein
VHSKIRYLNRLSPMDAADGVGNICQPCPPVPKSVVNNTVELQTCSSKNDDTPAGRSMRGISSWDDTCFKP